MKYKKTNPHKDLKPFIHFYWELKGNKLESQWERVFPDGCAGVLMNLGDPCLTDNGSLSLEFGKTTTHLIILINFSDRIKIKNNPLQSVIQDIV
ncbi:DUF6597 domain-containing transcriptional factor [Sphingobacterium chuzhouense]|uniref:DUF6597 domain-containing transcriptional factor n=1 Tax=Sphingobacterium chuzhouense TaxID=1742264 RepID=UPI001CC1FFB8|nr:DUF6597 domain-containing transcriptional factor [Sphingobacterium chuzhouense]